jgi:hypothetical protein
MADYIRIAVDPEVSTEVTELARKATHIDDLAPGRAIEWAVGEIKTLRRKLAQCERNGQSQPAAEVPAPAGA